MYLPSHVLVMVDGLLLFSFILVGTLFLVSWTSWDRFLGHPGTVILELLRLTSLDFLGLDWDERGQRGIVFIVFAS